MAGAAQVRALCILAPATLAGLLLLWRGHDRRLGAAALFATIWNLSALLLLHLVAVRYGWWRFEAQGGMFLGMPVDLYLGWALLWGAIPALAAIDVPLALEHIHLGWAFIGWTLRLFPSAYLLRWSHQPRQALLPLVLLSEHWLRGGLP